MNQELKLVEKKKVGQGLTELVGRHPTEGGGFVALGHSSFDGNNFPIDVAETGASAALVSDPPPCAINSPILLSFRAKQNLSSLHQLAPSYRQLMPLRPVSN
jgi:UDP-N-acetylmuramyl pentapeptide synthase